MGRLKSKTGLVLIVYSIIMTCIFIVSVVVVLNYQNKEHISILPEVILTPTNDELFTAVETGEANHMLKSYVSTTTIGKIYNKNVVNELPMITVIFCILITTSTFLLWIILKRMNNSDIMELVNTLNNIENSQDINDLDPSLKEAYLSIRDKFSSNIEDYKRLNSYISHEQKNALSILRTNLELKEDKSLIKSIDKVSDSIEDILTISASKDNIKTTAVDVALVCAEVCDEYNKVTDKIEFDFDDEGNNTILAKERWIYRALTNLIDNAIKYGDDSNVTVNVSNKKGSVIVKVKDNGIGMNQEDTIKIFNDRYRVNELKKDGYGIGLSLVNHVCKLCDGIVWVDSEEGEGSTFYLVFKEFIE
ncbi:MAG: HAMP domain-containing sensor histidine kinase [Clostridium sp.]